MHLSMLSLCVYCNLYGFNRFMTRSWIFDMDYSCPLFSFFFFANIGVSALSMAMISVNRFVRIFCPARMTLFSKNRTWIIVAMVWMLSSGMMLLPLLKIWGELGYERRTFSCTVLKGKGSSPMSFLISFGFFLPLLIMVVSYVSIYCKVRSTGMKSQTIAAGSRKSCLFQMQIKKCEIQGPKKFSKLVLPQLIDQHKSQHKIDELI